MSLAFVTNYINNRGDHLGKEATMFSSPVAVADESASNALRYSLMATVIACLLIVEFMALGGVFDGLSGLADAPSCGLTSFGQDV
jgi:hypothetical protein